MHGRIRYVIDESPLGQKAPLVQPLLMKIRRSVAGCSSIAHEESYKVSCRSCFRHPRSTTNLNSQDLVRKGASVTNDEGDWRDKEVIASAIVSILSRVTTYVR